MLAYPNSIERGFWGSNSIHCQNNNNYNHDSNDSYCHDYNDDNNISNNNNNNDNNNNENDHKNNKKSNIDINKNYRFPYLSYSANEKRFLDIKLTQWLIQIQILNPLDATNRFSTWCPLSDSFEKFTSSTFNNNNKSDNNNNNNNNNYNNNNDNNNNNNNIDNNNNYNNNDNNNNDNDSNHKNININNNSNNNNNNDNNYNNITNFHSSFKQQHTTLLAWEGVIRDGSMLCDVANWLFKKKNRPYTAFPSFSTSNHLSEEFSIRSSHVHTKTTPRTYEQCVAKIEKCLCTLRGVHSMSTRYLCGGQKGIGEYIVRGCWDAVWGLLEDIRRYVRSVVFCIV